MLQLTYSVIKIKAMIPGTLTVVLEFYCSLSNGRSTTNEKIYGMLFSCTYEGRNCKNAS